MLMVINFPVFFGVGGGGGVYDVQDSDVLEELVIPLLRIDH
jgi:hypothetical protein